MKWKRNIVQVQRDDHARLNELMESYRAASPEESRPIFREYVELAATHAFAEEEVLFPRSRHVLKSGEKLTTEIEDMHQRINELLAEMDGREPGQPEFEGRLDELFNLISTDAREEEDQLLPLLEATVDSKELDRLGKEFMVAQKTAPVRAHPGIPRRPPGNVLAGIPLSVYDRIRRVIARCKNTSQ